MDYLSFPPTLCLQEANASVSRGKITHYAVRVYSQHSGIDTWLNVSADLLSCLVPFCADCEVTVWSHNSKGASPPARVSTRYGKGSELALSALFHPVRKQPIPFRHAGKSACVGVGFTCFRSCALTQQTISVNWSLKRWVTTVSPSPGESMKLRHSRRASWWSGTPKATSRGSSAGCGWVETTAGHFSKVGRVNLSVCQCDGQNWLDRRSILLYLSVCLLIIFI